MPVTVPVPLPVVIVRVEGPFTSLDRKLWLVLLRHAHENLNKPGFVHTVKIADVVAKMRQLSGRRDLGGSGEVELTKKVTEDTPAALLWQSIKRLARTTIEWEDQDYVGINSLIGARMDKNARMMGNLHYTFDPILAENLLLPRIWARLNVNLILKLRSKYAVTLYEVLATYANRKDKREIVTIDDLRQWLKVPEEAYPAWKDLKRNVIDPAVNEINKNAESCGFTVSYEGVKEGKAFTKIRFEVKPTAARKNTDAFLQQVAKRRRSFKSAMDSLAMYRATEHVEQQVRVIIHGWDYELCLSEFQTWSAKQAERPRSRHGAFIGFAKSWAANKKKDAAYG